MSPRVAEALGAVRQWPRRALVVLVRVYRLVLSPWLGNQCRFAPTCSVYAIEALERHGALAGSYLAAARILRCAPWCDGGCDPVPAQRPRLFTHLLPSASTPPGASADGSPSTPPTLSRP
jgi:uncharacterized protein